AIALSIVLILDGITLSNMDLAVKAHLAALRAESGTRILAMIPPGVADRDNAAPIYKEAFDVLLTHQQLTSLYGKKPQNWWDITAQVDFQDKDLNEFLHSQEPALGLLRHAASLPECRFERDYFQSMGMLVPEAGHFRTAAALLSLDARVKAEKGAGRAAL